MDCIFCKIANKEIPSKTLYEDETLIVIMDINPKCDGHTLIIPKKHYTDYLELDERITNHIFNIAKKLGPQIMNSLNAKGLTMAINYGKAQVVKHFHYHLLPDYDKEPEKSVEETYSILKEALK